MNDRGTARMTEIGAYQLFRTARRVRDIRAAVLVRIRYTSGCRPASPDTTSRSIRSQCREEGCAGQSPPSGSALGPMRPPVPAAQDRRRWTQIIQADEGGTDNRRDLYERPKRDHLAVPVAHEHVLDV